MHTSTFIRELTSSLPSRVAALCLACLTTSSSQEAAEERPVDALSQSALQNAFQILRGEYIRGADLNHDELNRAAFQGLLERLDLGAELVRKSEALPVRAEHKVRVEIVAENVFYLRPCVWDETTAQEMQKALLQHKALKHLILDLRCPVTPGDFEVAAAVLELFIPSGELMFKLKQPGRNDARLYIASQTPVWSKKVILLVDEDTGNLGETVAAVLRARGQALLVGTHTRGATVRYETLPLDTEWLLRFARAEMLLEDETSLFRKGLTADFRVEMPLHAKRTLFSQGGEMKPHIFDSHQPRFNEAALLARKNPELDTYIRRSTGQVDPADKPSAHDTVLQRAVDMLLMHDRLEDSAIKWTAPQKQSPRPTVKKAQPSDMP